MLGIADIFTLVEINGKEQEIRISVNINQEQLDDYIAIDSVYKKILKLLDKRTKVWYNI